jgi:hypothetical protein
MQYKFLSHPTVSLLDNSGLSIRGRPIYKFFAKDGLHLSVQGTNIYASSMKSCIRRCLNIDKIQQAKRDFFYSLIERKCHNFINQTIIYEISSFNDSNIWEFPIINIFLLSLVPPSWMESFKSANMAKRSW